MVIYNILLIILLLLGIYYILKIYKYKDKISVIVKFNKMNGNISANKYIDKLFIVCNTADYTYVNHIKSSMNYYLLEHNIDSDDILFLIPLYSIIIKTKYAAICYGNIYFYNFIYFKMPFNYFTYKNCIYIRISYLKLLHFHTNIFRNCRIFDVCKRLRERTIKVDISKQFCRINKITFRYSIVTTLYRRNYIKQQLNYFLKQSLPPEHILVVHDRNILKFNINYSNILYVHTVNFQAGFYFRYLIASLSPEDDVIIYDDDFLPVDKNLHLKWLNDINKSSNGIYCHRLGNLMKLKWCATPLIVKRKLLFLQWINHIYEPSQAEDGHLSFSALLFCNVSCNLMNIIGILNIKDKFASPRKKLDKQFWKKYIKFIQQEINSTYILDTKKKFYIS